MRTLCVFHTGLDIFLWPRIRLQVTCLWELVSNSLASGRGWVDQDRWWGCLPLLWDWDISSLRCQGFYQCFAGSQMRLGANNSVSPREFNELKTVKS